MLAGVLEAGGDILHGLRDLFSNNSGDLKSNVIGSLQPQVQAPVTPAGAVAQGANAIIGTGFNIGNAYLTQKGLTNRERVNATTDRNTQASKQAIRIARSASTSHALANLNENQGQLDTLNHYWGISGSRSLDPLTAKIFRNRTKTFYE